MFDGIIAWSLRNRLVVILFYVVLAGASLLAISRMALDVFPEFAPPQVQIQTEAPGFAARDVELLVTRPLEVRLQGLPHVAHLRSNSSGGLSRITVVFESGVDIFQARMLVQERLQLASGILPDAVEPPQLMPVTSAVSWLLKFALIDWSSGARAYDLRSLVDWELRNRLLAQPGVASVVAVGGEVKQYQVEVDPLALVRLGLPFSRVVDAARDGNTVAPAAFLYPTAEEEYFVRAEGRALSLEDIGATSIGIVQGNALTLNDVGTVRFGGEIKRGDGQLFGGPVIIGTVSKLWGADTVETTHRVEETLKELARTLPPDVELVPNVFRQASFIERSIDSLTEALLHASLIVAMVLFLFLARWRPTAISLVAIPTSLMIGILVLHAAGIGLNALTLGGLIFAIGEVVDDAIIDVENIMRRLRENRTAPAPQPILRVVYDGSREIRNSMVFATFIILLAFLPVFLLTDIEGRILAPMGIAYLAAVAGSLLVALTLVPVLCSWLLARESDERTYRMSSIARGLLHGYRRLLARAMAVPRALAGASLALVIVTTVAGLAFLGRSFMPAFHEGNLVIAMTLMPGTSLEESLRVGREVMRRMEEMPDVALVAQRAGRSRLDEDAQPVNFSEFDVTLIEETRNVDVIMADMRSRLADIPGATFNVSQFISHRMQEIMSGVRAQVVVKIFGPDLDTLASLQQQVLTAVREVPGVADLQAEPMVLIPGVDLRIDRDRVAAYGLAPGEVVRQVGAALNGVSVSQVLEGDRAYDLYVRIAADARRDMNTLQHLPLQTPSDAVVPLAAVARLTPTREPYTINRDDGARRAVVQWNAVGDDLDAVVNRARTAIEDAIKPPPGYSIEFGGDYVGQQRATATLLAAAGATLLLIIAAMLRAFRSLPLVGLVVLNLPIALAGGILAMLVTGESLNVASLVGLIALFGLTTRNSILLLSRYQALAMERGGLRPDELAIQGAMDRLLPILMTSLTTTLAIIPFLVGDPTGKELQRPLAIVLLGGMFSSSLLNLLLLPTMLPWLLNRWPDALQARNAVDAPFGNRYAHEYS